MCLQSSPDGWKVLYFLKVEYGIGFELGCGIGIGILDLGAIVGAGPM
jgi:hypothetical protein